MSNPLEQIEKKYELLEKLGEGGMGAVYKARHRLLDELRVIKVMRSSLENDQDLRSRFATEAKTAVRLRHANIVQVYDFAIEGGVAYIAMEFLEGVTLYELLRTEGPPDLDLALDISRQALQALGYLHLHKVVHRDISPDNLMLIREAGGRLLVKLIDLGIAKRLEAETQLTRSGAFLGKFRYASPEQLGASGGVAIDARSDIYSFGIVLYQLLTDRFPIPGDSEGALIGSHLFRPPLSFAESDPGGRVPHELRRAVLKAMEKRPQDRFQSTDEFLAELDRVEGRHPMSQATTFAVPDRHSETEPTPVKAPAETRTKTLEETRGTRRLTPERAKRGPVKWGPVKWGLVKWPGRPWQLAGALLLVLALSVLQLSKDDSGVRDVGGDLVVYAVPWGEVVAVVDQQGTAQALAPEPYTPLALTLPPGTYEVTLKPWDDSPAETKRVEVRPHERVSLKFETHEVDLEEYFENAGW